MKDVDKVLHALLAATESLIQTNKQLSADERVALVTKFWPCHLQNVVDEAVRYVEFTDSWLSSFMSIFDKFTGTYPQHNQAMEEAIYYIDELVVTDLDAKLNLPLTESSSVNSAGPKHRLAVAFLQLGLAIFLLQRKKPLKSRRSQLQAIKKSSEEYISNLKKAEKSGWPMVQRKSTSWIKKTLMALLKSDLLDYYQVWIRSMLSLKSDQLEREKSELERSVHSQSQELSRCTKERDTSVRERNEAQSRSKTLHDANLQLRKDKQRLEAQNKELMESQRQLQHLNCTKAELERELKGTRANLEKIVAESTERVMALKAASNELQEMLDASGHENQRLQEALLQALDVNARIHTHGITEFQKDELIPSLSELEQEARSSHALIGRPLAQEIEKKGQKDDSDSQVVEIIEKCFKHFKKNYERRIMDAGKILYKQALDECTDIRRLFLSFISGSSQYARQCRYDVFGINILSVVKNKRLTHGKRCEQMFGQSITQFDGELPAFKYNFCCCELVHFCALMAIHDFDLQFVSADQDPGNLLQNFDIINEAQSRNDSSGVTVTYKTIWPAIRLPSTGTVIRGKAEQQVAQPKDPMDWTPITAPEYTTVH